MTWRGMLTTAGCLLGFYLSMMGLLLLLLRSVGL